MNLRHFLYLDRALVRDFLAQAEGGLVDEATERRSTTGRGGFGGKAGFGPAEVSAQKSKERATETEAVVHQVAASEFDRLYALLEQDDLVVLDEVSNTDVVGGIRRKQFLEVDARLQVAGMQHFAALIDTFTALAPMMEQVGADVQMDNKTLSAMQAFTALLDTNAAVPLVGNVPGKAGLKIALELEQTNVQSDGWNIDASVLLKVQRVIKEDERYMVGDPLGGLMNMVPASERAKLSESLASPEAAQLGIGDVEIGYPGLVGTPIAIYR